MISTDTAKKLTAIETAISLLTDSGIEEISISLNNIPYEDILAISENKRVICHNPSTVNPYMWCIINVGPAKIILNSPHKKVTLSDN